MRDTGNEIDLDHMQGMRQTEEPKKASSNMGLVESVNDSKVREKRGNKLGFYPKAPGLYFPVFHQRSTRNQKIEVLQQIIELNILRSLC